MAYNLGLTKLLGFKKMIAAIKRKDYSAAAVEMLDSKWHIDVGDRAVELARIMEEG
jgi:lysozyme